MICDAWFIHAFNFKLKLHCDRDLDHEGQGHTLFPMVDYAGLHIKINQL